MKGGSASRPKRAEAQFSMKYAQRTNTTSAVARVRVSSATWFVAISP